MAAAVLIAGVDRRLAMYLAWSSSEEDGTQLAFDASTDIERSEQLFGSPFTGA